MTVQISYHALYGGGNGGPTYTTYMLVSFSLSEPVALAAETDPACMLQGIRLHNWQCTVIGDGGNIITCRDIIGLKPLVIGQGY